MTIPKGIDYGFTITVIEKDSFLPQDLQNMDLVNSSFKLCTIGTLCDVTTGTATMTRLEDELLLNVETTDTLTQDYSVGDFIHQTTANTYYECITDVDSKKYLSNTFYFSKDLSQKYDEAGTILTRDYSAGSIVYDTVGTQWYKCIATVAAKKYLTDSNYFIEENVYNETTNEATRYYAIGDLIKQTTSGIWYKCIEASVPYDSTALTGDLLTGIKFVVIGIVESTVTSNTLNANYVINNLVFNSVSFRYYRCIAPVSYQELLTNSNNFVLLTVKTEATPEDGITNNYSVGDYAHDTIHNLLYVCLETLTATESLTSIDYFTPRLIADLTTYKDGKVKVVLDSTLTASLSHLRGDAVDGYYLKPTYQGVINIKFTDGTPERTAIIEKVYVAPTGVVCV